MDARRRGHAIHVGRLLTTGIVQKTLTSPHSVTFGSTHGREFLQVLVPGGAVVLSNTIHLVDTGTLESGFISLWS